MNATRPDLSFERLLLELEREVLAASDEEIVDIAHELGMKPEQQGSSALFGVTICSTHATKGSANDKRKRKLPPAPDLPASSEACSE